MARQLLRATVKDEHVDEAVSATKKLFATLDEVRPADLRYASCRVADTSTFVILVEIADGAEDPRPGIPGFAEFQANIAGWLAGPPTPETLQVVGSYGLFD
jgi:hypothetical protein